AAGVGPDRIALDPGIGFGKTMAHNLELLRRLEELTAMERPMLLGVSRKSFLRAILGLQGSRDPEDRRALLDGTLAAVTACVLRGAAMVRVHDVGAARRAV